MSDCWPQQRDIEYLRYRATELRHTIILETSEEPELIASKFIDIPGIIFIALSGRVAAWRSRKVWMFDFDEIDAEEREYRNICAVFGLCGMGDAPSKLCSFISSREFILRSISDTSYPEDIAQERRD